MISSHPICSVSLFSGAGGLDYSACTSGVADVLFSTDSNKIFLETVSTNIFSHFPHVKHIQCHRDSRELSSEIILNMLGQHNIDLVFGGPPCDDFTSNGKKQGLNGSKGSLIFTFAKLINELRPNVFLFENVPNLMSMCRDAFNDLLSCFDSYGYSVKHCVLKAADYGSPTLRKRLFVIGFKNAHSCACFQFPRPMYALFTTQGKLEINGLGLPPFVTVKDVLYDLPDVCEGEVIFNNHTARKHSISTLAHIRTIMPGIKDKKSYRYRAPWDGLCHSLTAGLDHSTKSYIHPIYHREMTVREYARIHGFPDTWYIQGTVSNGLKQMANAVPIPMGSAIFSEIFKIIKLEKHHVD